MHAGMLHLNTLSILFLTVFRRVCARMPYMQSEMATQGMSFPSSNSASSRLGDSKLLSSNCLAGGMGRSVLDGVKINIPGGQTVYNKEKERECMQRQEQKAKEIQLKLLAASKELMAKATHEHPTKCPPIFQPAVDECYAKQRDHEYTTTSSWEARVYDLVGQVWKRDDLVYMIVAERAKYEDNGPTGIPKQCLTAFTTPAGSSLHQNLRGQVVGHIGDTGYEDNKSKEEEDPCAKKCSSRKRKREMFEGKKPKCAKFCDSLSGILNPSGPASSFESIESRTL